MTAAANKLATYHIQNIEDMQKLVADFQSQLQLPAIICLDGEMGAGKTTFTRLFCESLGFQQAASPTYALHHRYQINGKSVDHWDLYRLQSEDELESAGFWENIFHQNHIAFIEWSKRISLEHLPMDKKKYFIELQLNADSSREIRIRQS